MPTDTPCVRERVNQSSRCAPLAVVADDVTVTDCPESGTRTATSVTLSLTAVSGRTSSWVTLSVLLI